MPANLRGSELLILLLLVLLLFGARRLPDLARSVGRSMKIFRSEVKDLRSDEPTGEAAQTPQAPAPQDSAPQDPAQATGPVAGAPATGAPSGGEDRRPTDDGESAR